MRLLGLVGSDSAQRRDVLLRLVGEMAARGIAVAVLSEAPEGFDPDVPGKDSYEHRRAGAAEVLLMAPHISALMHENHAERPDIWRLARKLWPAELVLADGFEAESHPKIRIGGATGGRCDASVLAVVDSATVAIDALADLVLAKAKEVP